MSQTNTRPVSDEFLRDLDGRIAAAHERYEEAAAAIGVPVLEMAALIAFRNDLTASPRAGNTGLGLFAQLRDEGVRIRSSDGRRLHAPDWMHGFGQQAHAHAAELRRQFDETGSIDQPEGNTQNEESDDANRQDGLDDHPAAN